MEWANFVAEKNEGILFPAEIRVVGSYTDRLLNLLNCHKVIPGNKKVCMELTIYSQT